MSRAVWAFSLRVQGGTILNSPALLPVPHFLIVQKSAADVSKYSKGMVP